MLRSSKFFKLEGLPEYKVKVSACGIVSERLLCKINCIDEDGISVSRWVDENTGSFYSQDGICKSSEMIRFVSKPIPSGRMVPSQVKREIEGHQRSNAYRWGFEDDIG